jgi:hypothetical protein
MVSKNAQLTKKLAKLPQSKQFDLFTQFYGEESELSNTIEFWDAVPKFAYTARRQNKARDEKGRLGVHRQIFVCAKRKCRVQIQPASIELEDGSFQDFYPSTDEELVEEVLRKVFTDQQFGLHDVRGAESWVKFSLQMIRKELKKRGKTRSIDQIKRSIDILSSTIVTVYLEGEKAPICRNAILCDVVRVSREQYLEDGSTMWLAKLPALVSKSVNELSYRQFNYAKLMDLKTQLSRWLHKRLSHNYTNASIIDPYSILFTSVQRDSGLLAHPRAAANVKAFEGALEELIAADVLFKWEKKERRGARNKIEDALYTFHPHPAFVSDVKAANKRQKEGHLAMNSRSNSRSGR